MDVVEALRTKVEVEGKLSGPGAMSYLAALRRGSQLGSTHR